MKTNFWNPFQRRSLKDPDTVERRGSNTSVGYPARRSATSAWPLCICSFGHRALRASSIVFLSSLTRSLTLARCAKTPVRTEVQDWTTPPARRAPAEDLGFFGHRALRASSIVFLSSLSRSLTLARRAKTPVRTEVQDRTTPPARRAPAEDLGFFPPSSSYPPSRDP